MTAQLTPQRGRPGQSGQATLEFLGTVPFLLLAAACCVQGLLVAATMIFAHASARAVASGPPSAQQRGELPVPEAWRRSATVVVRGDTVTVTLRAPFVLPVPADPFKVSAERARLGAVRS